MAALTANRRSAFTQLCLPAPGGALNQKQTNLWFLIRKYCTLAEWLVYTAPAFVDACAARCGTARYFTPAANFVNLTYSNFYSVANTHWYITAQHMCVYRCVYNETFSIYVTNLSNAHKNTPIERIVWMCINVCVRVCVCLTCGY